MWNFSFELDTLLFFYDLLKLIKLKKIRGTIIEPQASRFILNNIAFLFKFTVVAHENSYEKHWPPQM